MEFALVAIGAGAGLAASTRGAIVYAEGVERKQKLPVYDEPEPEMVVKEEPTRLDEALRAARKETDRQILGMKYHLQMVTDKVVDIEKEAETTIKSVLVKEEEVMPAALYVVVAGFAGSIVASRRNILLRFLSPVAFSAMAFGYFFPASSNRLIEQANRSDLAKYIPSDLQKQFQELSGKSESKLKEAVEQVKHTAQEVKVAVEKQEEQVQAKVQEAVEEVKKAVEVKPVEVKPVEVKPVEEDTRKNV
ncbi:hypothetical protein BGZ59_010969 [Podila verticillata]|nr:hypothetical protein BGZ59_010969 [Podila verticillata]